jgi:hypothetical protein
VNALLFALLLPLAQDPPSSGVRMGVTVLPETVTVGTPFRVMVRISAPRGATVAFPAATDSLGGVELLDPRTIRSAADSSAVDQTATYRLAAWEVGTLPIALGNVVVSLAGVEQRIPIESLSVHVASVLPADTTKRDPKPARDLMDTPTSMWRWWLIGAVVAVLLALLLWMWLRRKRADPAAALSLDPYVFAQKEFTRIESLGLVEAGERERFVALMVEVVRDYLARRVNGATAALTSTELLQALRAEPTVPVHRLAPMLAESDLVKFARAPLTADRAKWLGEEARAIVQDVDEARATAAVKAAA